MLPEKFQREHGPASASDVDSWPPGLREETSWEEGQASPLVATRPGSPRTLPAVQRHHRGFDRWPTEGSLARLPLGAVMNNPLCIFFVCTNSCMKRRLHFSEGKKKEKKSLFLKKQFIQRREVAFLASLLRLAGNRC